MKKLLLLSLFALLITACEEATDIDADGNNLSSSSTAKTSIYLADLSATSYPDTNTWVILDETATTADFAGFSAAIEDISTNDLDRRVSIEFPSMVTIPGYAIYGYTTITDNVNSRALGSVSAEKATTVGEHVFNGCSSLTTIDMPSLTTIGDYAFAQCTVLTTVDMPSLTTIGEGAFLGCESLTTVDMPLVTSIGESAFFNCTALTTFDIPLVTTIEGFVFGDCSSLTTIDMPSVTTIGEWAFRDCSSLTTVDMPSVTSIGSFAFYDCTSLTTLKFATEDGVVLSSIVSTAFSGVTTTDIDLTVGAANASLVSGSTLTVDGDSFEFKSITVL